MRSLPFVAALPLLVLLLPPSAEAGGVGVVGQAGIHRGLARKEGGGESTWFDGGAGVEIDLGKNHGRAHARIRFLWNAAVDLAGGTQHAGVLSIGGRIELTPDTEAKAGLYLAGDLGVSPAVTHLRTFFFVDVGPGLRVDLSSWLSLFVEATFVVRVQEDPAYGPWVYGGLRFQFD